MGLKMDILLVVQILLQEITSLINFHLLPMLMLPMLAI